MKKQTEQGYETDKALSKTGSVKPTKKEKIETERPIAEKDEVKQAEERQYKQIKDKGR